MTAPTFFKHPQALVETAAENIGEGTRIWAFAHVLAGARIGRACNICNSTFVENEAILGDRVTLKCGVYVWNGVVLEDDVFVGPNAAFTNDPFPRSRRWLASHPRTLVRRGASIGANATILPGLEIGQHAMVGAGAVVTRDVPPYAVVVGNPARIVRYSEEGAAPPRAPDSSSRRPEVSAVANVQGVSLHRSPIIKDLRGNLSAREQGDGIPFTPKRYFVVFDVPSKEVRGAHAHRACHQLLVSLRGSVACMVDDGHRRGEVLLEGPELAIHIPPMIWGVQYKYSADAVLMVLASNAYDPDDYIRDYDQFLRERQAWERTRTTT